MSFSYYYYYYALCVFYFMSIHIFYSSSFRLLAVIGILAAVKQFNQLNYYCCCCRLPSPLPYAVDCSVQAYYSTPNSDILFFV
jgi:hypothetical protein